MNTSFIKRKLPFLVVVLSIIFVVGGYYAYKNVIQSKVDNITPQTLKIDLKNSALIYNVMKYASQKKIFQIELTITGKSSENITLLLGSEPRKFTKEIKLKKGKIDFAFINEWYGDNLFIKVDQATSPKGQIAIEYQFIGMED